MGVVFGGRYFTIRQFKKVHRQINEALDQHACGNNEPLEKLYKQWPEIGSSEYPKSLEMNEFDAAEIRSSHQKVQHVCDQTDLAEIGQLYGFAEYSGTLTSETTGQSEPASFLKVSIADGCGGIVKVEYSFGSLVEFIMNFCVYPTLAIAVGSPDMGRMATTEKMANFVREALLLELGIESEALHRALPLFIRTNFEKYLKNAVVEFADDVEAFAATRFGGTFLIGPKITFADEEFRKTRKLIAKATRRRGHRGSDKTGSRRDYSLWEGELNQVKAELARVAGRLQKGRITQTQTAENIFYRYKAPREHLRKTLKATGETWTGLLKAAASKRTRKNN